jgi:hypothetical protein
MRKYNYFNTLLLTVLSGIIFIMPSCGGGGGGGGFIPPAPTTTASLPSGVYAAAQSVTLTANSKATIYYSLDGNMPSVGGSNTLSGPSPVSNIQISSDTNLLQFFSVDASGKQEAVKSETYVINNGTANGPGDPQGYFPLNQGNTWGMQVTGTENGYPTQNYADTYAITGTKSVSGATAVIYKESNPYNSGTAIEDYPLKSSNGVLLLGYNDPSDPLTSQLVPYYMYNFALQPGSSYVAVNKAGLDFGEDIDWDGKNETAAMSVLVTMKGFEPVTVPDGTYSNCAKIETNTTLTVTLSSVNKKITVTGIQTEWFAPGVGPVKSIITTTGDNYSSTQTEELAGYIVNGMEHGVIKLQQTGDALDVTDSSAILTGNNNSPSGILPTTWFEYGPTTSYGFTATTLGNPFASITGLQQLTTYHYRMVTSYLGFTIYGNDRTFKTLITPTVVASGLDSPFALALDAMNIYATESNAVIKVAKTGGVVTTLVTGVQTAYALAVDATSVYWGEYYGSSIKKVGVNGGNVTTLASNQGNILAVALDANSVYWSQGGSINKVGINGGNVNTIVSETANAIVVDSTDVYYTLPNGGLKRVGLTGGTAIDLPGTTGAQGALAIDAVNVYYFDGGLLKKINKNDNSITALTSVPNGAYNIAVDGTDVFWIENDNFLALTWFNLKKVGINGGAATTLAVGLPASYSYSYGLGVDTTYVYWTEQNVFLTSQGMIKMVPKSY